MKKIFALLMIVFFVFIFSSCGSSEPTVVGSDDTTAESTTTQESITDNNTEINNENTTEQKSDVQTTASVGTTKESEKSNSEKNETSTSDNIIEATTAKKSEADEITIKDDEIIAPAYKLEIPDGFEVKSDSNDPLLENKKGTIQFNIMDKTDTVTDFEKYVTDTYNSAAVVGMAKGDIENVTVAGIQMKRFSMIMMDDDGGELDGYAYLAQVNDRVLLITLTSKDGALADASEADAFVESIEF